MTNKEIYELATKMGPMRKTLQTAYDSMDEEQKNELHGQSYWYHTIAHELGSHRYGPLDETHFRYEHGFAKSTTGRDYVDEGEKEYKVKRTNDIKDDAHLQQIRTYDKEIKGYTYEHIIKNEDNTFTKMRYYIPSNEMNELVASYGSSSHKNRAYRATDEQVEQGISFPVTEPQVRYNKNGLPNKNTLKKREKWARFNKYKQDTTTIKPS